jgi:hypothetical protein
VLRTFLERHPHAAIAAEPRYRPNITFRGLEELRLELEP